MEWIQQYGAAGAFVLLVVKMFLESRRAPAADVLEELQRNRVTPERIGRLLNGLESRFEMLPEVIVQTRMRQVDEIHTAVRDIRKAIERRATG